MEADEVNGRTVDVADVLIHNQKEKEATEESDMDIIETEKYYVVTFFPNAEEVEIDDKPEKGYKAIIGLQDGEHIVMKVMYDKSIYPYDEDDRHDRFGVDYEKDTVKTLAGNIRECPICKRLNANVAKIEKVQLYDRAKNHATPAMETQKSKIFDTGNPFQDLMARMLFDTKLNKTGQVAVAMALEDEELMEKVMPTSIDGIVDLMATFTELSQGKGDIYRSPAEVTEYVKALRKGADVSVDKKTASGAQTVFRRPSTIIVS